MHDSNPVKRPISRRRFLTIATGAAGAFAALAAFGCAQPAAAPTATEKPAAAAPAKAAAPTKAAAEQKAPAKAEGASLKLWLLKTYVEPTNQAIEAVAQDWAKANKATVAIDYYTFEDVDTKYVAAIETKSTPDVGQLQIGAPQRFAGMGQLLDLSDFFKQIQGTVGTPFDNFRPIMVTPDGKVVSIAWYLMPAFWYVWQDVLDKKGVKPPDTYEDAKAAAAAVTDPSNNFYGIGQSWNRTSDGYGVMQSLLYSYGAGWTDKDGKYQSIQTDKWKAAMTWATDIYKNKLSAPDTLSWTGSQNNENFIAKNIAQTSNGPSITFAMEDALAKATDAADKKAKEEALANARALPHPAGPDGRRMWGFAQSLGIFQSTKYPDAAKSLVEFLLGPEQQVRVMEKSSGQFSPVLDKAADASKGYFDKNENYKVFGQAGQWFAHTGWPGPITAAAAEVQASNVLTDMPAKVIIDGQTVEQALEFGDKKIKEIYDTVG